MQDDEEEIKPVRETNDVVRVRSEPIKIKLDVFGRDVESLKIDDKWCAF